MTKRHSISQADTERVDGAISSAGALGISAARALSMAGMLLTSEVKDQIIKDALDAYAEKIETTPIVGFLGKGVPATARDMQTAIVADLRTIAWGPQ